MLISQLIKGRKEKFFINQILDENISRLHHCKSCSAKNAIINMTYQHDCKDFNTSNYKLYSYLYKFIFFLSPVLGLQHGVLNNRSYRPSVAQ